MTEFQVWQNDELLETRRDEDRDAAFRQATHVAMYRGGGKIYEIREGEKILAATMTRQDVSLTRNSTSG